MLSAEEKVFEEFDLYPWDKDSEFQAGLKKILITYRQTIDNESDEQGIKALQLLRAKHFYFSRIKKSFDLNNYIEYEKQKKQSADNIFKQLDQYDFENDEKYINGLPMIIQNLIEQQVKYGSEPWDRNSFKNELTKAKAIYYSTCIERVDVQSYITWKSKKKTVGEPKCPFANLWDNNKGATPRSIITPHNGEFVAVEKKFSQGPCVISLCSPSSTNTLSISRMNEIIKVVGTARVDTGTTALLLCATVADDLTPEVYNPDALLITNDTKVFSSGPAFMETALQSGKETNKLIASLEKLSDEYYNLAKFLYENEKLMMTFLNGRISKNSIHLTSWPHFTRVINENALLELGIHLSHAPIPPISILSVIQSQMTLTRPLPAGLELYLALADPDNARLRAPELLRVGLADYFIPENHYTTFYDNIMQLATCPAPYTSAAVKLELRSHKSYAGPDRLGVWENEIKEVFGKTGTFQELVDRLRGVKNKWSEAILKHWSTLPPTLLKVIFIAVQKCKSLSPREALELEQTLNSKWRQTEDYAQWKNGKSEWKGSLDGMDEPAFVSFYFEKLEKPSAESLAAAIVYDVPVNTCDEEENMPTTCPVTGFSGTCPVSKST